MVLGKLDSPKEKSETLPYPINKNEFKMYWRLECKAWNCKTPRKHILLDTGFGNKCLNWDQKQSNKTKKQVVHHQTKELLHRKENHQQNLKKKKEKPAYWMGESVCKSYTR